MTTTTATQSKQLTKKELKKFQELLEEKRKAVLDRAREIGRASCRERVYACV